jgi:bifunctional non-homologous end joining protein LigD
MTENLKEYKAKRKWDITKEPKENGHKETKLVIQEHIAERAGKHYDWRIPYEGVLKSFVTRKLPAINEKVLFVPTEDHPMSYATFEGEIPKGTYGAGKVKIYGKYNFKMDKFGDDKIKFDILDGDLKGTYTAIKINNNFLLHRGKK